MHRSTILLLSLLILLSTAAAGCAAHLKETKGVSRLGYSIQVGAFSDVKNAERLTARLQEKGIDAFYFKRDSRIYAVRFGDYPTWDAAKKHAKKLVSDKMIDSYFIASPQSEFIEKGKKTELKKYSSPVPRPKPTSDMGGIAARTAERFVGIPYRWGGNNVVDGMDCSGFVRAVYNLCGVNIPRTSREQFGTGENIDRDDLKDGDLVFFGASRDEINHVGIYVGNRRFVHAPRRGADIKISSLDEEYFVKKFIGGKRYF
ncbi:C40 family peptidase [Geobacter sp. DSM 9736]|uniref:C40 family peptidase n=1 Tax=Geobacter sp. DSM 9736 TaxID=1277350 RepID=UPI000B60003A|nr:NlpC/P60 family protein [Geobacter sp. DSM 9736]SNB44998.1 Sporulation related domain-containing protein [Geobacter sp. DSM 9736]